MCSIDYQYIQEIQLIHIFTWYQNVRLIRNLNCVYSADCFRRRSDCPPLDIESKIWQHRLVRLSLSSANPWKHVAIQRCMCWSFFRQLLSLISFSRECATSLLAPLDSNNVGEQNPRASLPSTVRFTVTVVKKSILTGFFSPYSNSSLHLVNQSIFQTCLVTANFEFLKFM